MSKGQINQKNILRTNTKCKHILIYIITNDLVYHLAFALFYLIIYKNVEDNGGYPPPIILYLSIAYARRG